jgi:hypothetical protein
MEIGRIPRATLALLIVAVLAGGVALGSVVTTLASRDRPIASATPGPTVGPTAGGLPGADVAGEDLPRLPRYPGSVRTEFEVSRDDRFILTAVEYFADATLDEVRQFYQGVIEQHGWQRADITYAAGEWTYLLVDGSTEALVEIEVTRGFVEIDLQVSSATSTPPPATPVATATPSPQPPAPPPPDDDDGDDDDGDSDDDDGDDTDD